MDADELNEWQGDDVEKHPDLLLTGGQYDLFAVDKPERQRARTGAPLVSVLREVFPHESERSLWMTAGKVIKRVGLDLALRGVEYLRTIPGWVESIQMNQTPSISLATRIEQAAATVDNRDNRREVEQIMLDLGRLKAKNEETVKRVTAFFQAIHTAHPTMRAQIKTACEQVLRNAHRINKETWLDLAVKACEVAYRDQKWRDNMLKNARVPSETVKKVTQIMVHLNGEK